MSHECVTVASVDLHLDRGWLAMAAAPVATGAAGTSGAATRGWCGGGQTSPCAAMNPFQNAKDSIRSTGNSLLGKEKTWKDEVGEMCPSLTYTQARTQIDLLLLSVPLFSAMLFHCLPLRPTTLAARRVNGALTPRVSDFSDSGGLGSAARWASSSAWGCVAPRPTVCLKPPPAFSNPRA